MPKTTSIVSIDIHKLHEEMGRQSALYTEWAEALASADADLDDLNTELELVEAEVSYAIRRDPKKYDVTASKLSETMIKKIVPMQPEYQDAVRAVNAQKRKVGHLKAAVKGLDQKKSMLEKLSALWLGGYYSEPKMPRGMMQDVARQLPAAIDKPKKKKGA